MNKLEIEYPCSWEYKIIGDDENSLRDEVAQLLKNNDYNLFLSKKSSSGRFVSLNLKTVVSSEAERTNLYKLLKNNPLIKIVI